MFQVVFRQTETRDGNRASFIFFIQLDETLPTKFLPLISLGSIVIRRLFLEWGVGIVAALFSNSITSGCMQYCPAVCLQRTSVAQVSGERHVHLVLVLYRAAGDTLTLSDLKHLNVFIYENPIELASKNKRPGVTLSCLAYIQPTQILPDPYGIANTIPDTYHGARRGLKSLESISS